MISETVRKAARTAAQNKLICGNHFSTNLKGDTVLCANAAADAVIDVILKRYDLKEKKRGKKSG